MSDRLMPLFHFQEIHSGSQSQHTKRIKSCQFPEQMKNKDKQKKIERDSSTFYETV